jgi:hypothetical protein
MAQGQMKGINIFFLTFPKNLPINYNTLKLAIYLEEALGNMKYHHLCSGIPNTRLMLVLLDHGSSTNTRDQSIFIPFPESLPINYTTLKLATYLEEALGNKKNHHLGSGIPNKGLMLVLVDHGSSINERDPNIHFNLSKEFAHKLHYFKVGH